MAKQRHIALLGMPGAGKSTIGRLLAAARGLAFFDTDAWIEERSGVSIPEIFDRHGERIFRAMEGEALRVLESAEPSVVAVGGGLVTVGPHARLLRGAAYCVFLDVAVEELVRRLGPDAAVGRPLLQGAGGVEGRLVELLEERGALYEKLAHLRVECGGLSAEQVVEEIVRQLG